MIVMNMQPKLPNTFDEIARLHILLQTATDVDYFATELFLPYL